MTMPPQQRETDQRQVLTAVRELATWATDLRWEYVPVRVRDRLRLVLLDSLAVTMAGGRLPERGALVTAWELCPGPCPVLGAGLSTGAEPAAWLNASAMVSLEMDEGNKHAAGHPAAHGFPAVLALAAQRDCAGPPTAVALLVAYEVAARFGRAARLRPGVHPHGNWGLTGGAAGCARLLGVDADGMAAAMDTASGMPIAGHFAAALDGNPVRHEWMGATAVAGLAAARLAAAGAAHATGIAARSLGEVLGSFDPAELTDGLGSRWDVELGYFKRHASCAFTHPAVDTVLRLREGLDVDEVTEVVLEVPSMVAALDDPRPQTRLAAMFSLPFVTATAVLHGVVEPGSYTTERLQDPRLNELAARVRVITAPDLDRRLPAERGARVLLRCRDGTKAQRAVRNPIGDADHQPFDEPGLLRVLAGLLGPGDALARVCACADGLFDAPSVRPLLAALAAP